MKFKKLAIISAILLTLILVVVLNIEIRTPEILQSKESRDGKSVTFRHPHAKGFFTLPKEIDNATTQVLQKNSGYVGPEVCAKCHQEHYDSFVKTAHYNTSKIATAESIHGALKGAASRVTTSNEHLTFEVFEEDQKFYQQVKFWDKVERFPMDIVTGSGKMGQSYLFWQGDALYQHQLTYFRETDTWINSPGYEDGSASYERPIFPGCLECHATYADTISKTSNRFRQSSIIFGVTCERCHGEGLQHVEFHQMNPSETKARFISKATSLVRERGNEVCAQCHSGANTPRKEPFSYRPGKVLADFFEIDEDPDKKREGGVHTDNQLVSLKQSACFQKSQLTCATCHNPHQQERGNLVLFSKRCLNCHETKHCGMSQELDVAKMQTNCVDCHMPLRHDVKTTLQDRGTVRFPLLRDHFVRVDKKHAASLKSLFAK